ncbi:MAG: 30S ribosomal protein S6 [Patescibacteria group bacterium]
MDLNKEELSAYEIYFLLVGEDTSKIKDILLRNGAKILNERPLEKSRLAYPIKKQVLAYAGSITFEIDPTVLEKLGVDLKLEAEIIRLIVTKLDLRKMPEEQKEPRVETFQRRRPSFSRERKKPENVSLTNEALEKKIEEILK